MFEKVWIVIDQVFKVGLENIIKSDFWGNMGIEKWNHTRLTFSIVKIFSTVEIVFLFFSVKFLFFFFFFIKGWSRHWTLFNVFGQLFQIQFKCFYNTDFLSIHVRWRHFEVDESNPVSLSISSSLLSISSSLLSISFSLLSISSA